MLQGAFSTSEDPSNFTGATSHAPPETHTLDGFTSKAPSAHAETFHEKAPLRLESAASNAPSLDPTSEAPSNLEDSTSNAPLETSQVPSPRKVDIRLPGKGNYLDD